MAGHMKIYKDQLDTIKIPSELAPARSNSKEAPCSHGQVGIALQVDIKTALKLM
jgi:hypothetical protein